MIFDQILHELRTTNDLLRLILAVRDAESPRNPYPAVEATNLTLWEDLDDLLLEAATRTTPATPRTYDRVPAENMLRHWSEKDDLRLLTLLDLGFDDATIGGHLGRSPKAVTTRRRRLGYTKKGGRSHV